MTAAGLHARAGTWPDKGQQNQPQATTAARGLVGVLDHTPEFAPTYAASVTSVTVRVPHDGNKDTNKRAGQVGGHPQRR